jgi:hypothetical protein
MQERSKNMKARVATPSQVYQPESGVTQRLLFHSHTMAQIILCTAFSSFKD